MKKEGSDNLTPTRLNEAAHGLKWAVKSQDLLRATK